MMFFEAMGIAIDIVVGLQQGANLELECQLKVALCIRRIRDSFAFANIVLHGNRNNV